MTDAQSISDHWGAGDVYARIMKAMEAASISPDTVTVEQMAPVDHFHARGFPATVELADTLPIQPGHRIVDIGCGIGGPARYLAERFGCRVSGVVDSLTKSVLRLIPVRSHPGVVVSLDRLRLNLILGLP